MSDDVISKLAEVGVVPLVTLGSVEESVPLARALLDPLVEAKSIQRA